MRHPHGLRSAAKAAIVLPAIGTSMEGGFFAGAISHTANGVATHLLIVAPQATGASGSGYTVTTSLQYKITEDADAGTTSSFNGAANSANIRDALHPAALFCENLSIGDYSDWYLPARYELDIAYENLKPGTQANSSGSGPNAYAVPERTDYRTAGAPAQTSLAAFQTGGAEAFSASVHWSSTEVASAYAYLQTFSNGQEDIGLKSQTRRVRAFRKVAV